VSATVIAPSAPLLWINACVPLRNVHVRTMVVVVSAVVIAVSRFAVSQPLPVRSPSRHFCHALSVAFLNF
jgi:hypothetical protein